jgi:hypothetical protein
MALSASKAKADLLWAGLRPEVNVQAVVRMSIRESGGKCWRCGGCGCYECIPVLNEKP